METRIKNIEIKNLFNWKDHSINLNENERITILHGPNGIGKTTILLLIKAIFEGDFIKILRTKFTSIKIVFNTGLIFSLTKENNQIQIETNISKKSKSKNITISRHEIFDEEFNPGLRNMPNIISHTLPFLDRIGYSQWIDKSNNNLKLDIEDILIKYGDLLNIDQLDPIDVYSVNDNFKKSKNTIREYMNGDFLPKEFKTYLIETQRLYKYNSAIRDPYTDRYPSIGRVVEHNAIDMAKKIQDTLKKSGELGANLDRTFPARLLNSRTLPKDATNDNIWSIYNDQQEYRQRLTSAGLLDNIDGDEFVATFQPPEKLDKAEVRVLWHYLMDARKKLEIYENILKRIETFQTILKRKKFLKKEIIIDKNKGYRIVSSIDGTDIPLHALSSGEQHQLVFLYQLLFIAPSNSLVMIDEPEISLHVNWQLSFLDDLENISDIAKLDFLIATHSPTLIKGRKNLMVALTNNEEQNG